MHHVTVRYFAAARAASGVNEEVVELASGATIADLVNHIESQHGDGLRQILRCSSLLLDEIVVRDRLRVAGPGSTIDVLPPFAGG
ncbi:MoaD/ThiS family protein [Rhodococcus opacus]|uniref:MoaD/ThiS family protein n=1 Tax=Rhodococcus opacus TaxID=37919 RepID=UPI000EAA24CF|nr:MoaD/ThiS family protein [Rhodococcus opacus]QZS52581.1 MoaD/ThiS family protein [Rhodococcus opacus]RKM64874.1 molybdopterin synthase sulfur carrier subunit [Rhodococcus opacus]